MDRNLKCCILGCQTRPNQGLHFYRFPCHNPQVTLIWKQRISQSANIDFDVLNDRVCELHFDYRCKTGNECALEEGSLPTLNLSSYDLFSTGNAHFQINANRIEEPSYTISIDALSYHCRLCLRKGLLYEVETSTYRSKSFLSLIDLPPNVLPDNTQPNACLSCLKSIVIANQLSMVVENSNTVLQLLLQHPKHSKVVSNTNFFDMKSELALCNLIVANSLCIKLEIEDNMVCANEDFEQKWIAIEEPTSSYSQNMFEKPMWVTENHDNVSKIHDSVISNSNEFHKSFAIKAEYITDLSAERITDAIENIDFCVLPNNTDKNAEVMVSNNSDDSCVDNRQFNNEQSPESHSKAVNEPTYKCDLCKFTTNYKATFAIHTNLHSAGNDTVHFYCQKCKKEFLLHRHFVRHNTIIHGNDFICKICYKPQASASKLTVHYKGHQRFQSDISSTVLRSGHCANMIEHKQGQMIFTPTIAHWNENDGEHVCPICDWRNTSFHTFNVHMGKHKVQSRKNNTIGSQELETLKTDSVRYEDGRYQCTECPKAFRNKTHLSRHKRTHSDVKPHRCTECQKSFKKKSNLDQHKKIHSNERPYECTECSKTFSYKSKFNRHKRIHTNERPYKCNECPKAFRNKDNLIEHQRIHSNERPYKCTDCPKAFRCKSDFNRHKRIHTNERPYKCTECPKTFTQKSNCDIHKVIHTNERPYKCTECPKDFSFKGALNVHKRIHTNERPYKCTECTKAFRNKDNLIEHQRIHSNERPYKCTECPKAFRYKSDFNRHKRIHTNETI